MCCLVVEMLVVFAKPDILVVSELESLLARYAYRVFGAQNVKDGPEFLGKSFSLIVTLAFRPKLPVQIGVGKQLDAFH